MLVDFHSSHTVRVGEARPVASRGSASVRTDECAELGTVFLAAVGWVFRYLISHC